MIKTVLCLLVCTAVVPPAMAGAITIFYGFEDSVEAQVSGGLHADQIEASGFTVSDGKIGFQGGTSGLGSHIANTRSWSNEEAFDPSAKFWEFSITPAEGYGIEFDSLSFELGRTKEGPTLAALHYSLDHFTGSGTELLKDLAVTSDDTSALDAFEAPADHLPAGLINDTIAFRIWGYAAPGTGNLRINDLQLTGTVSAIPEPSAIAAMAGLGSMLLVFWRRRAIARSKR